MASLARLATVQIAVRPELVAVLAVSGHVRVRATLAQTNGLVREDNRPNPIEPSELGLETRLEFGHRSKV